MARRSETPAVPGIRRPTASSLETPTPTPCPGRFRRNVTSRVWNGGMGGAVRAGEARRPGARTPLRPRTTFGRSAGLVPCASDTSATLVTRAGCRAMTRTRADVWNRTNAEGDWHDVLKAYELPVGSIRDLDPPTGKSSDPLGWRFQAAI